MKAEDYKLIPMSEITDEAREIAVAWMECEDKHWIGQKHKLASDIMNYAKLYSDQENERLKAVVSKQEELIEETRSLLSEIAKENYSDNNNSVKRIAVLESELSKLKAE